VKSLRRRLLLGVAASIGVLVLLFGGILYAMIRHVLIQEFDAFLLTTTHAMAASTAVDHDEVEIGFDPADMPQLRGPGPPVYFQFWLSDGTTLFRSPELGDTSLPRFSGPDGGPACRELVLANGEAARALGVRFTPIQESEYTLTADGIERTEATGYPVILVVARSTEELDARLRLLRMLLLAAWGLTMAVGLAAVLFTVGRGLRPLHALARRIAAVREDDLSVRISPEPMPVELAPVVEKLNDLLRRLEAAVERERGFAADVAHELRTPLAGVRTTIEVALSRRRQADEYAEALHDSFVIVERMQTMVERLLMLAHLEGGRVPSERETVPLGELVDACWAAVSGAARSRGIRFENGISPDAACVADRDSLIMIFTNLLENTVEYADEGGRIWTASRRLDSVVEVTVANTGCALSPDETSQVFERFWRGDASRSDTGVRCGLGLALLQRLVSVLGGKTSVRVLDGGIFEVSLILPAPK